MVALDGSPSDACPEVLATGRSDITTFFVSMSTRHPDGKDAEYLEWHTLDHRPEQYRLDGIRASIRIVSTPDCRRARAVSSPRYDAVDHVMTYMFADSAALGPFGDLGAALQDVGRIPGLLPMVERGVYRRAGMVAAPRIKIGADVLPWWPSRGIYLIAEVGDGVDPSGLAGIEGVAGAWWMTGAASAAGLTGARDRSGLQLTYCFLDDDPVATAARLSPELERRWSGTAAEPLLAAPFHVAVPFEWDRHLP